jgi:RNA-directed DNA polymerase
VEADINGVFDHLDHDGLLPMRRWRTDDLALLGLIRKWRNAGLLETDGRVFHSDTDVPPGGGVSPV